MFSDYPPNDKAHLPGVLALAIFSSQDNSELGPRFASGEARSGAADVRRKHRLQQTPFHLIFQIVRGTI